MSDKPRDIIVRVFSEWAAFSAARSGYPRPKARKDVDWLIQVPDYEVLFDLRHGKITQQEFDKWHESSVDRIISNRKDLPVEWAAKLINVYLKCRAYVASQGRPNLLDCLHPPIDTGLWRGIRRKYRWNKEILTYFPDTFSIKGIKLYGKYRKIIEGCTLVAQDLNCRLIEVEQLWPGKVVPDKPTAPVRDKAKMAKFGRGLNREIVSAINSGSISEPFSVQDVRRLIKERCWNPPPAEQYIVVTLANAASNSHSSTYKKYFRSIGEGHYELREEFRGKEWL